MRYIFALSAALALAGCSSTATMSEEAAPLASSALSTVEGMRDYLVASGAEVVAARQLPTPPEPGVESAASYRFDGGGRCTVVTYTSSEVALQYAPASVQRPNPDYRNGADTRYGAAPRREISVPTIFFGPNAALCQSEPREVTDALQALGAYAETSAAPAPAAP